MQVKNIIITASSPLGCHIKQHICKCTVNMMAKLSSARLQFEARPGGKIPPRLGLEPGTNAFLMQLPYRMG